MKDEISYLLGMPSEEIMKVVLQEALKDLTVTPEEQALISGIKHDLSIYSKKIPKLDSERSPFTKNEIQILLIKQRRILKKIVSNTYKRAEVDGTISSDEMEIYRALLHKVDEITARKISMFMNFDSLDPVAKTPHLLTLHEKIGQKFTNLTATIIMNIFSEKVKMHEGKYQNIQEVIREFSSEKTNKEFVLKFIEALQELAKLPMENPKDLIVGMDHILEDM